MSQGSFLWFILVGQTRRSYLWVILVGHSFGWNSWFKLAGHFRGYSRRSSSCSNSCISLWIILGKEYAIKKLFYFCPTRLCNTRSPVWSNIIIKHPLAIIKGKNISDAEHELFMIDIGNNYQLVNSRLN